MERKRKNEAYNADTRVYGIDLLRIVSMLMVPIMHVLGQGGVLGNATALSAQNEVAYFLEIAAYCAVNTYALISGYVGYGRRYKYSNIIYLYFQVIFYTILTTLVFLLYKPELVGLKTIVFAVVPFAYNIYWYFTAYFCLSFVIPFLNEMIDKFERKTMQKLLISLFVIFSILPTAFYSDFGYTGSGYSFLWLAILYLVGAYIKKYDISLFCSNRKNLLGYFLCVVLTWLTKILIEILTEIVFHEPKGINYLMSYTSPTIIFCSIFLLLYFKNLHCSKGLIKFIRNFAPVSFGVYLFHQEPLIRDTFIKDAFVGFLTLNPFLMALAVIGAGIGIWFVGSMVDRIRLLLFELLKIKQFSISIENLAMRIVKNFQRLIVANKAEAEEKSD